MNYLFAIIIHVLFEICLQNYDIHIIFPNNCPDFSKKSEAHTSACLLENIKTLMSRGLAAESVYHKPSAENLEQHAGDADAEILTGKEEIAFHHPFAKRADGLIAEHHGH